MSSNDPRFDESASANDEEMAEDYSFYRCNNCNAELDNFNEITGPNGDVLCLACYEKSES